MQNGSISNNRSIVDASVFEHMKLEHTLADADFKRIRDLAMNFNLPEEAGSHPLIQAVSEDVDICPMTKKPCEAGSHAKCKCFWDCIVQAIKNNSITEL